MPPSSADVEGEAGGRNGNGKSLGNGFKWGSFSGNDVKHKQPTPPKTQPHETGSVTGRKHSFPEAGGGQGMFEMLVGVPCGFSGVVLASRSVSPHWGLFRTLLNALLLLLVLRYLQET